MPAIVALRASASDGGVASADEVGKGISLGIAVLLRVRCGDGGNPHAAR
jgi:hypothetical protein